MAFVNSHSLWCPTASNDMASDFVSSSGVLERWSMNP